MKPLVVVGDALLDVDVEGGASRLCPEAPVPVVDVEGEWVRPGGAGLAAILLAARSAGEVLFVTALGDDRTGHRLSSLLAREVEVIALPLEGETVSKTRVRASGQSVVRLDAGGGRAGGAPLPARARAALGGARAVLVSDYGRGITAHPELRGLLATLTGTVPVVWDPHPRGCAPVPGVTLATPNESEALALVGGAPGPGAAATGLRARWRCHAAAVTLGARGAVLSGPEGVDPVTVPVPDGATVTGEKLDTCGAGDRFAGAATAALADGTDVTDAVASAVEAASRFVGVGGAAALSVRGAVTAPASGNPPGDGAVSERAALALSRRVRGRGGRVVATGGCFDLLHAGHVSLLRQARALGDALIVCLNSDESVRRRKGEGRPVVTAADRARLLAELSSVDAVVVFDEPAPSALLDRLRPDVWVKGGDYDGAPLPESAVVRRHGGEVVLLPTVEGYSTTRLLRAGG